MENRLCQLECDVFVLLVIISKKQKRKRPNSTWKTITAVAAVWSIMPPLVIDTQRDWFYFRKTVHGVPLQSFYTWILESQKAFDTEWYRKVSSENCCQWIWKHRTNFNGTSCSPGKENGTYSSSLGWLIAYIDLLLYLTNTELQI